MPPPPSEHRGRESRRHERVVPLAGQPVEIQIMGGTFLDVLFAKDISVGGVGVVVPHGFEGSDIESEVELVIKLPGRSAFLARGIIRHTNPAAKMFGVEFTRIDAEHRRRVEQYVSEVRQRRG